MKYPPLKIHLIFIILSVLPVFAADTSIQDNLCQSENCQDRPGICGAGYFCFLTESNIPGDIKCSKEKVNSYLNQKITENRFAIEADSRYIERYKNSVMEEQLSKGCMLSELKPLLAQEGKSITLTSEFINYQVNEPLDITLGWYLKLTSSGEEINVTGQCPQHIILNPLEHRIMSCVITDSTILTDVDYIYYSTGSYALENGGTETIFSKEHRIVYARSIADTIASAGKSLVSLVGGGLNSLGDWVKSILGKSSCDKNPSVCSITYFCYLTDPATKEFNTTEKMKAHISGDASFSSVDNGQIEKGCLPASSKELFQKLTKKSADDSGSSAKVDIKLSAYEDDSNDSTDNDGGIWAYVDNGYSEGQSTKSYCASCEIDWGDGKSQTVDPSKEEIFHAYVKIGTYDVSYTCQCMSDKISSKARISILYIGPVYEPKEWTNQNKIKSNNCYSYSTAIETKRKSLPGAAHGKAVDYTFQAYKNMAEPEKSRKACDEFIQASEADGLVYMGKDNYRCRGSSHAVALVMDLTGDGPYDRDFHWYRRDNTGYWSHKYGGNPVTNLDTDGKLIKDPKVAARAFGEIKEDGKFYGNLHDTFCGYFCVDVSKVYISGD